MNGGGYGVPVDNIDRYTYILFYDSEIILDSSNIFNENLDPAKTSSSVMNAQRWRTKHARATKSNTSTHWLPTMLPAKGRLNAVSVYYFKLRAEIWHILIAF